MTLNWPKDITTWLGLTGLVVTGLYQLAKGQTDLAIASFSAAAALLGIGSQATTAAVNARDAEIKAGFAAHDTQAIRNDPNLPGAALSSVERLDRARESRDRP